MSTYLFEGRVNEVYPELIQRILSEGATVRPRGTTTLELNPAILEIKEPSKRLVTAYGRPVNVAFALVEVAWILAGSHHVHPLPAFNSNIANYSDNGETFNAAYGKRIRWEAHLDQVEDMIAALINDPDTRQATLTISLPARDRNYRANGSKNLTKDRACNVFSHAMIRDGALNWLQILRSNDALWGVPYNIMQWTHVMEHVAYRVGVPLGKYTMLSDSMHIYSEGESAAHFESAQQVRYFDLYEELGYAHAPLVLQNEAHAAALLTAIENLVECGDPATLHNVLKAEGINWGGMEMEILNQAALYLFYKMAAGMPASEVLMYALEICKDNIYTAAQMRFFYANRFSKAASGDQDVFYNLCAREYGVTVAEWIFGL